MARRNRWVVAVIAIPLVLTVGLLSVGEPADAWGAPTPQGVTVDSSLHPEQAVLAARRTDTVVAEVLRVVRRAIDAWSPLAASLAIVVALVEVRRRAITVLTAPRLHRLLRGDPLAQRRGPPLVLSI